jgi:GNAT superfamily N-acetyltransferase
VIAGLTWREQPIERRHDRKSFDCGVRELNEYLERYARQNHRSGGAKTFVAVDPDTTDRILGFYTLSPGAIEFARVPEVVRKGLGRYEVPVFRLARLAVDTSIQGQGLGGQLLMAAGERCLAAATEVGGVALAIDAKDQRAKTWYAGFGAFELLDTPNQLVLPLATLAETIRAAQDK